MNILFLGGDKRYQYMMEDLCKNHNIFQIGFDKINANIQEKKLEDIDFSEFDVLVFPISGMSKNREIKSEKGKIVLPNQIFQTLNQNTLVFTGLKTESLQNLIPEKQLISFLDDEEVEKVNNDLTVAGTIDDIKDRKNDTVCILGYGKLGKELTLRLSHAGIRTFVISRPKDAIYQDNVKNYYPLNAQNITEVFQFCDIVINTIPYHIIPEEAISKEYVPYILDIASFPYGIDEKLVEKYQEHMNYHLYLGIPSKFAPKEASAILLKTLKKVVDDK